MFVEGYDFIKDYKNLLNKKDFSMFVDIVVDIDQDTNVNIFEMIGDKIYRENIFYIFLNVVFSLVLIIIFRFLLKINKNYNDIDQKVIVIYFYNCNLFTFYDDIDYL